MPARRPWSYAVGGAVVAVAAVVVAIAVAGDQLGLTGGDQQPAPAAATHHRHRTAPATTDPTPAAEETTAESASPAASPAATAAVATYLAGDTPSGPRLFREFTSVRADGDLPTEAVNAALARTSGPHDPDYSSLWPDNASTQQVSLDGDAITVDLVGENAIMDRPDAMTDAEARLALQQVVYTAQAALQTRAPVRFLVNEQPADRVLGVDTGQPVAGGDPLEVLSLISISDPAEGATVHGTLTATGVASSFEANVPWQIRQGDQVVKKGFTTAEGWMDKLYPWKAEIDVSDLAPGEYTFVAMTDDPSAGEGNGPYVDTRTITVR
nr:Gmad2 immunoglobulin-like domain-containing protein [Nocardioides panaciterrulae]